MEVFKDHSAVKTFRTKTAVFPSLPYSSSAIAAVLLSVFPAAVTNVRTEQNANDAIAAIREREPAPIPLEESATNIENMIGKRLIGKKLLIPREKRPDMVAFIEKRPDGFRFTIDGKEYVIDDGVDFMSIDIASLVDTAILEPEHVSLISHEKDKAMICAERVKKTCEALSDSNDASVRVQLPIEFTTTDGSFLSRALAAQRGLEEGKKAVTNAKRRIASWFGKPDEPENETPTEERHAYVITFKRCAPQTLALND